MLHVEIGLLPRNRSYRVRNRRGGIERNSDYGDERIEGRCMHQEMLQSVHGARVAILPPCGKSHSTADGVGHNARN